MDEYEQPTNPFQPPLLSMASLLCFQEFNEPEGPAEHPGDASVVERWRRRRCAKTVESRIFTGRNGLLEIGDSKAQVNERLTVFQAS